LEAKQEEKKATQKNISGTDFPDEEGRPASQDILCNVLSMLKIRDGRLEWTQVMRSNDLFRGVPYNFVQFTVLQEVIAGWLGLEVGAYDHVSDSLHVYEGDFEALKGFDTRVQAAPNTHSLRLPKEESDEAFAALERRLDAMTADWLTEKGMQKLLEGNSLPEAFQNFLRVAAADSARRRGWTGLSEDIIGRCTVGALLRIWEEWALRTGSP
jgi:thymidylate synthase